MDPLRLPDLMEDGMPDPVPDLAKLVADYDAAENALRAANEALNAVIPDRTIVLRKPGSDSGFVKAGGRTVLLKVQYLEGGA